MRITSELCDLYQHSGDPSTSKGKLDATEPWNRKPATAQAAVAWSLPLDVAPVRRRTSIVGHEGTLDPDAIFDIRNRSSGIRDFHLKQLAAYIALFGLVYSICYLLPYAMSDDYAKLYMYLHSTLGSDNVKGIEGGRPLLVLLTNITLRPLHTYQDLRYLAIASILGIALLAWMFHRTLLRAGFGKYPAAIIPVLMCVAPAFQLYAAWAVCAYYPYVAMVGGGAALAVAHTYQTTSLKARLALSGLGVATLLCALLIYQPAAMMYWVVAAVFLLAGGADARSTWARFILNAVVAGVALALALIPTKLAPIILDDKSPLARSTLASDYLDKAHWFVFQVLPDALNLYAVTPRPILPVVVAAAAAAGVLLFVDGSWAARVSKAIVAVALVPLCYLPNLVVAEDWVSYRTQVALTSLVILYVSFGLIAFRKLRLPGATVVGYGGLLALALVGTVIAARNVAVDFAIPQYQELALMRSQLASPKLDSATSVYLIPPRYMLDAFAPDVRYDEFGVLSSATTWSEQPMVYFALHDVNPSREEIPVIVAPATGPFNPPPGSFVVDMRSVRTLSP